jgi:hypothetical protein
MSLKKHYTSLLAIVIGAVCLSQNANAQLLGYEGFNYTSGSALAGQSTGSGLFGTWTTKTPGASSSVASSGLTYTDGSGNVLSTSGNSGVSIGSSSTDNPQLLFGSTLGVASGATATAGSGTIWMSFLWQGLNTSSTGSFFRQASFGLYYGMTTTSASGSEALDIGIPNISSANVSTVNPNLSVWYGGHAPGTLGTSQTSSSTAPAIDTGVAANGGNTLFVVLELQMDNSSTTADTLNMWVNPTLGGSTPTGTKFTYSLADMTSINGIRMSGDGVNATYGTIAGEQQYDEFRAGGTFADVSPIAPVPEPSTMSLAGISGVAILLALRRRQA